MLRELLQRYQQKLMTLCWRLTESLLTWLHSGRSCTFVTLFVTVQRLGKSGFYFVKSRTAPLSGAMSKDQCAPPLHTLPGKLV